MNKQKKNCNLVITNKTMMCPDCSKSIKGLSARTALARVWFLRETEMKQICVASGQGERSSASDNVIFLI